MPHKKWLLQEPVQGASYWPAIFEFQHNTIPFLTQVCYSSQFQLQCLSVYPTAEPELTPEPTLKSQPEPHDSAVNVIILSTVLLVASGLVIVIVVIAAILVVSSKKVLQRTSLQQQYHCSQHR